MTRFVGVLAVTVGAGTLVAACGDSGPVVVKSPPRDDWIIESRIDVGQGPLEAETFQLIAPYNLGDLYGQPNSEIYLKAELGGNGSRRFTLDLNQGHDAMLAELAGREPKRLNDRRMSIEPPDARIVTVSPEIVDHRFARQGVTNWVDRTSGYRMRLIYFDRPARLTGHYFDVQASEAGYVWVVEPPGPQIAHAVPQPSDLVLAFDRR